MAILLNLVKSSAPPMPCYLAFVGLDGYQVVFEFAYAAVGAFPVGTVLYSILTC